jgi:hypothetical protein
MESPASRFLKLSTMIFPVLLPFLRASAAGIASDTLNNGGNITDGETLISSGSKDGNGSGSDRVESPGTQTQNPIVKPKPDPNPDSGENPAPKPKPAGIQNPTGYPKPDNVTTNQQA